MRSRVMPALLTSTSMGPCSATAFEGVDRRLPVGDIADRGVELVAERLCSAIHFAWSRLGPQPAMTLNPSLNRRWQMAVPIPHMPPVT